MVFSSVGFLFYFLPLFLVAYFIFPWKNATFLCASLLFYSWGEGSYVLFLLAVGLINWWMGLWLDGHDASGKRRVILGLAIGTNLTALTVFKYADFAAANLNLALSAFSEKTVAPPQIHLPIGISFFVFQAISYLVDIHRRQIGADRSVVNVLLYLAMFPHQLAGPIVRFGQVAEKLRNRKASVEKFALGIQMFALGLGQKVLIANTVAVAADQIFQLPVDALTASLAWLGAICYTFQIYFDFAGYSTMAAGLAIMLGLYFPRNFAWPYVADSMTDFWRRWHISLSTWFRDYVYIPLGGNRGGSGRTYANLFIVFVLCGLWHGANWTFVIWGLYHGLFLVVERLGLTRGLGRLPREIRWLYTLLTVIVGWVIFRADSLPHAWAILAAMAGFGTGDGVVHTIWQSMQPDVVLAVLFGAVAATPYFARRFPSLVVWPTSDAEAELLAGRLKLTGVICCVAVLLLSIASAASGGYNPFIYFRF
jgi:alginate O-acetyltransferase complex protein AlgI